MPCHAIHTTEAPAAVGIYSQAIQCGSTVYLSGQLAIDPKTQGADDASVERQIRRVFENLRAVAVASGGSLADVVKLNIYLTDLRDAQALNRIMGEYFSEPYPARAAIGIASLPNGFRIEAEAVLVLE